MPTIIASILSIVSNVVGGLTAEQTAKITLAIQQDKETFDLLSQQAETNAQEASNPSIFVAGWRPFIGWGLGSIVVFYAFLTLMVNFGIALGYHVATFPPLDPMVRDIIMGMLGLNIGSRTFEKYKNVVHRH